MPKKKPADSAFGLFMKDLQQKHAKKGNKIPLSQMKDIADPQWKMLSAEQKQKWNEKAKLSRRLNNPERLTSDGLPVTMIAAMEDEKRNKERQMALNIREYVHGNEQDPNVFKGWAVRQTHFIMSFNIVCYVKETDEYYPLEVGIVEYSILEGIKRRYHKFISPGSLPLGYSGEAKRNSEATHQIPFTGHPNGENDYLAIMKEIESFLCPHGVEDELPPIFVLNDATHERVEETYGCLHWLCKRSGYFPGDSDFKVWDLRYLLLELRQGVNEPLTMIISEDMLTKTTFDFTPDTRCSFHEDIDNKDCALGFVVRMGYLLSDCLCGVFEVELSEKHLPSRTLEERNYEVLNPVSVITLGLPRIQPRPQSKPNHTSSGLYDLEEDEPDLSLSYTPASRVTPRPPTTALEQLRLSSNSSTCTGQGLGRGQPLRK